MIRIIGSNRRSVALVAALAMLSTAVLANPVDAGAGKPAPVRFATFNASLNRNNAGDLAAELVRRRAVLNPTRSPRSSSAPDPTCC